MIGSCRSWFNPWYRQHFSVGIFQDLSSQRKKEAKEKRSKKKITAICY